jgi:hypothetical protein
VNKFGSIAFGVRCGKGVDGQFVKAWTRFLRSDAVRPGDVVLAPVVEFPHHIAAEMLMWEFVNKTECDSIMYLDDDMTFRPEDVDALRDNPVNEAFDVVYGLACSSKGSVMPIIMRRVPEGTGYGVCDFAALSGTVEVDCAGLAFTIITRDIAQRVRGLVGPTKMLFCWGDTGTGEDEAFCRKVQEVGGRIGVDTGVPVGHRVRVCVEWVAKDKSVGYYSQLDQRFVRVMSEMKEQQRESKEN